MSARLIDVSQLEPPEPMQVALAELETLANDDYLVLQHRREPFPLYAMLATMGFEHRTRPGCDTAFEIVIWRRSGPRPEEL